MNELGRNLKKLRNMNKERSIWANLGFALLFIPAGLFILLLIQLLNEAMDKVALAAGSPWVLLIVLMIAIYILALIFLLCEPMFRRKHERKKEIDGMVSGLILYWREKLAKQKKPQPSDDELEWMRGMMLKRVEFWVNNDPYMWHVWYRDEKYPKTPFGILDHFMATSKYVDYVKLMGKIKNKQRI